MALLNELPELVENNIISVQTARDIERYYATRKEPENNSMLTIFGALGGILVGLGIILIFAHNWDTFPKTVKTLLAFLPLVVFQVLAGYSIFKDKSAAWREASGTLVFFSVGAAIALVGQIYNIPGNTASFLMTWILLCVPLIYVLRSNVLVLLHIIFSTYYAVEAGYFSAGRPWLYLLFLAVILPYYISAAKKNPGNNFVVILHWLLPISLVICLGAFLEGAQEFGLPIYISVLSVLYNIGLLPYFRQGPNGRNGYLVNGLTGITVLLLFTSFKWFWETLAKTKPDIYFIVLWVLFLGVSSYILTLSKTKGKSLDVFSLATFIFPLIYLAGLFNNLLAAILCNV
ncbi:MAG: DUF2157 domain-containing protein, partial [Flavobacterium sp.]